MSRVGSHTYRPLSNRSKPTFDGGLDLVDAPNLMDLGEKPKIFPNLGIFVIKIPKNRNFRIFFILGEFVFEIWI